MPLINVVCTDGHHTEVMRPIAMWPATPPCPTCAAPTTQELVPPPTRYSVDPVIVYKTPDGSFRFPGDPHGASAANYDRQGFERIELRNAADVRRFETVMNKRELIRAQRRVERAQQGRELRESHSRSELRHLMQRMTPFGRNLARAAMSRNDNKPRERAREAGFHVDCYSNDRSNREVSRDAQGRRRRD